MAFWVEKRRYFSLIMFLLIALEIFYVSSLPGSRAPSGIQIIPVIYHFSVFFLFSFFLFFFVKGERKTNFFYIAIPILLALIYAILDEIHQHFVPLRSPSIDDVLIDLAGITLSLIISVYISKKASQNP